MVFSVFCEYMENFHLDEKNYIQNLKNLYKAIEISKTAIMPKIDNYIESYKFDKNDPFFRWTSNINQFEIFNFLNGNETTLFADILLANHDVVKFNHVYLLINISSSDKVNQELEMILKYFQIELTYYDSAHYKLNNKVSKIKSNYNMDNYNLVLKYRYGCNNPNEDCDMNNSLRKLKKNRPILSPYTLWKLKLVGNPNSFKRLNDFRKENANDEISIYLCGSGEYLKKTKIQNCSKNYLNEIVL